MPKPKFKFMVNQNESAALSTTQPPSEIVQMKEEKTVPDMLNRLDIETKVPFNLKIIPRNKIVMNEKNDYAQSDIEELAASILQFGLIHNLEALYDEEIDVYILESGERRTRALDYLLEKFKDVSEDTPDYSLFLANVQGFEFGYPVNVKRKKDNIENDVKMTRLEEIDSELRIHAPNLDIRSMSQEDRLKNISRRKALLDEKNSLLPRAEKINVNEEIASQEGISKRQVQKYNNILNLIPELQEEFKNNHITLNEGSTYAALSPEDQLILANFLKEGKKLSALEIKKIQEDLNKSQEQIEEKENMILQLQEEKRILASESAKQAEEYEKHLQEEKIFLEEEIRKELSENNPDKMKLEKLESQIADMERISKDMLVAEQKKLEQKNRAIEKLEEEINLLREKEVKEAIDINTIKAEARLELAMEQTRRSLDALVSVLNDTDGTVYKENCIELLMKYINNLK